MRMCKLTPNKKYWVVISQIKSNDDQFLSSYKRGFLIDVEQMIVWVKQYEVS
jgi:hypothetical protein